MQHKHRVRKINPTKKGPAKAKPDPLLQPGRQLFDLLDVIRQVLVLLLTHPAPGEEGRINEPFLVFRRVGGSAVEAARQEHERIAGIQLGVERLLFPRRTGGVVP